jgi:hypothetical protein
MKIIAAHQNSTGTWNLQLQVEKLVVEEGPLWPTGSRPNSLLFAFTKDEIITLTNFPPYTILVLDEKVR